MFYCLSIVCILIQVCSSREPLGWNYINLHCRDNDNKPVGWWYLYKPPLGRGQNLELGRNFSYISPRTRRWEPSEKYINANSMLQHTLSPLYRPTYANYLAVITYSGRHDNVSRGSAAHGLMMADEVGGVWMGHTVPGLLDFKVDRPSFPAAEMDKGHLIMCLSLDLPTLNLVASSIRDASPRVVRMRVPQTVRHLLPNWQYFSSSVKNKNYSFPVRSISFETTDKSLQTTMLVLRPGERRCLYRAFARNKRIVLDVYGHDIRTRYGCERSFGVRKINSISLKYPESVYYIDSTTDRANFAVSTAAHWQRKGDGPLQHWACISTVERENVGERGGIVVCVKNYTVWWSFDNMKINEPKCYFTVYLKALVFLYFLS